MCIVERWQTGSGCAQTGDTSAYAVSIAGTLHTWGEALYGSLVVRDVGSADGDSFAFEHVCGKMVANFIPHLLNNGIMKHVVLPGVPRVWACMQVCTPACKQGTRCAGCAR